MSVHSTKQPKSVKRHKDAANATRSLMEHFNDRLTLDNLRLSERYLDGKLHILMHFRHGKNVEYVASFQREMPDALLQEHFRIVDLGNVLENSGELISDLSNFCGRHAMEPILRSDSEQQAVLVNVVQAIDLPEDFSVASRVRFDLRERFYSVRRQTLFYSPNSGFKFLGIIANREIDALKRSGRLLPDAHQPVDQMVEGTPKILDGVSNNQWNVSGNGLNTSEIIKAVTSVRHILGKDWISTSVDKSAPELSQVEDVFFGPF